MKPKARYPRIKTEPDDINHIDSPEVWDYTPCFYGYCMKFTPYLWEQRFVYYRRWRVSLSQQKRK